VQRAQQGCQSSDDHDRGLDGSQIVRMLV
jgi:hypothetical protein